MGQAAEMLGVSTDTVRRWADAASSPYPHPGGRREVAGAALADLARTLAGEPRADDIVSASARNRFTGIVTRVIKDTVTAQVELQPGPHRVVALLSREAAAELARHVAVASVKATNVVV